jgi:hypothetical protein
MTRKRLKRQLTALSPRRPSLHSPSTGFFRGRLGIRIMVALSKRTKRPQFLPHTGHRSRFPPVALIRHKLNKKAGRDRDFWYNGPEMFQEASSRGRRRPLTQKKSGRVPTRKIMDTLAAMYPDAH